MVVPYTEDVLKDEGERELVVVELFESYSSIKYSSCYGATVPSNFCFRVSSKPKTGTPHVRPPDESTRD